MRDPGGGPFAWEVHHEGFHCHVLILLHQEHIDVVLVPISQTAEARSA